MHSDFNFTVNRCFQAVQLLTKRHSALGVHLARARSDIPGYEGV